MSDLNAAKTRILSRVPLADLIGDSISPKKRSGLVIGLCPFHEENTPSFYVYSDHFHCYGCKAHGDAISYVQKTQGLGFIHALKWLAQKYGIDAPELEQDNSDKERWQKNAIRSKIILTAQEFFKHHLCNSSGKSTLDYLISRGFNEEFVKEYGFGYAPDTKNQLVRLLISKGFSFNDIKDCSLANGDQNYPYDFFQNRLMVPIRDFQGRLIAFGGRTMGDDAQKYKNSRYDKKNMLFGFDQARKHARPKRRIIIVEGYMDTLQLWQFGFTETVACQGTALTYPQMRLIDGATDKAYLLFDGDQAGRNANLKIIEDALDTPGVEFMVANLPDGEDPDSFVKAFGKDALEELLSKAEDLVSYVIKEKLSNAHGTSVPEVIKKDLVPWLLKIKDPVKRDFLLSQISTISKISKSALNEYLKPNAAIKPKQIQREEPPPEPMDHSHVEPLSPVAYELLSHLYFADPGEIEIQEVSTFIEQNIQQSDVWVSFAQELVSCLKENQSPSKAEIMSWPSTQPQVVAHYIANIKNKRAAFDTSDRKLQIKTLITQHLIKTTKNSISKLRESISQSISMDEKLEILKSVSNLNKKIQDYRNELS